MLCHPGQVKPHSKFKAEVYILKKEEGGRHTPFHNKYRPQFYIRTLDVTGEITLPNGVEMVMPGDNMTSFSASFLNSKPGQIFELSPGESAFEIGSSAFTSCE